MRRLPVAIVLVIGWPAAGAAAGEPASRPSRLTVFERLSPQYMARFDRERADLASRAAPIEVPYPFVRGTFHMHSELSHDSRGRVEEIITAAKATGTRIVGFTEHPSREKDVIAANVKGWRDGVFFLAGTESNNTLCWPAQDGELELRFVCHPEEVGQIDPGSYAGMEIYNTHSDAIDEPTRTLLAALLLNLPAVKAHPQAAFASFLDYPQEFLARFDTISLTRPFSGIAANDSHQNQGFKLVLRPDGSIEAFDAEGESSWKADGLKASALRLALGKKDLPGAPEVLTQVLLDPYEVSMRHVGTFLQVTEVTERTVRRALRAGRAVVAFESIAPLPAFGFWVEKDGRPAGTVGDRVTWAPGLSLQCRLPLPADLRIIRDGQTAREHRGASLSMDNIGPGVYRAEAFLQLAGERRPWVITNPVYVRPSDAR